MECRTQKALNGQYDYQFQTADGRPVYKRTDEAGEHIYLFYDKECDGDSRGKDNVWGVFVLIHDPETLSKTALSDVDRDHKCMKAAYTAYGSQGPTDRSRPYYHGKAGALPGKSVKWDVYCGRSTGWTIQTLRLSGHFAAPGLKAKGAWRYVTTVKQGETRTESYGFDVSNSKGGAWDGTSARIKSTGSDLLTLFPCWPIFCHDMKGNLLFPGPLGKSGEVAVEIQGGLPFVGGEKVEAKMTAEARSSMERSWSQAVNSGSKLTRKIPFKDGGGALWQWHFVVQGDSKSITFPANDFALTKNGMEQPQCYPSLSLDGWKYQKCVPGGHL